MTKVLLCGQFAVLGVILFLAPNMTRRDLLFAVPVAADFRKTAAARRAMATFRWVVAVASALGLLALATLATATVSLVATFGLIAVTLVAFYKANRLIAPFAVTSDGSRSVVVSKGPEQLPRFIWLGVAPFVFLASAAIDLHFHWSSIPLRYPIHFGLDGTPNGWAERTVKGVYGPLVYAAELCVWFFVCGLAAWYGARRTDLRLSMLELMIGVEFASGSIFAAIALLPLMAIPVWVVVAFSFCLVIPLVAFTIKKSREPSEPPEKTPSECWKGGVLYYNPNDPVVFLEKRSGFGYTVNFANPWAWALLAGLVVVIATTPLLVVGT